MRRRQILGLAVMLMAATARGQETGVVEGFVGFGDNFPPPKKLTVTKDHVVCGRSVPDEEFVIDPASHGLANAVIFWALPEGEQAPAGPPTVVLAQEGCRYEPHVQVAGAGAGTLQVLNNDGILHNVHVYDDDGNTFFNFAQPGFKKQIDKDLPDSRIINVQCDVHDWMSAWIISLPNSRYAITDAQGRFRLEGLAPGSQQVRIWHEGLGSSSKAVTVVAGQVATLDFVIGK